MGSRHGEVWAHQATVGREEHQDCLAAKVIVLQEVYMSSRHEEVWSHQVAVGREQHQECSVAKLISCHDSAKEGRVVSCRGGSIRRLASVFTDT